MNDRQKYSEKTNPAYKGALGCFDYLMTHRDDENESESVIAEKEKTKEILIGAIQDPDFKDMIVCAYNQELLEMEAIKSKIGNREYNERLYVLKELGRELGIEQYQQSSTMKTTGNHSSCCLLL